MKRILAVLLILCCSLPAFAKKRQNEEIITPLTKLEKRQFQTKTYEGQDSIIAMKALLNVLQDEGFIVYNVNSLLGYIYGVKDFDISDPNIDISKEFGITKSRLNYNGVKVATLEVSVNVTQYGEISRLRVNFKRKLLNEYGNAQMISDIEDAKYYEDFYEKVDFAMNIQKQILQKINNQKTITIEQKSTENIKNTAKTNEESEIEQNESSQTNNVDDNKQTEINELGETEIKASGTAQSPEYAGSENEPTKNLEIENDSNKENPEQADSETSQEEVSKKLLKQKKEEEKQAEKEAKQAQKKAEKESKRKEKEIKE